jgi:hypothetical protein
MGMVALGARRGAIGRAGAVSQERPTMRVGDDGEGVRREGYRRARSTRQAQQKALLALAHVGDDTTSMGTEHTTAEVEEAYEDVELTDAEVARIHRAMDRVRRGEPGIPAEEVHAEMRAMIAAWRPARP